KASDSANQQSTSSPATVEQNLPQPTVQGDVQGPQSSEQSDRREETTNYELNTKRVATVSNGYTISRLSIAVVVNRQRLADIVGANATPEQIEARVAEIQTLVASAAGYQEGRGDAIT